MRLYNQTLLRYNDMTKTHVNKPTRVVVVNKEIIVNEDDNDGENDTLSEIVATMPTSIQPKARMLTARLKKVVDWNGRGELLDEGVTLAIPALRSTTPPLLLIAKVTVAECVIKATRCDWLVATINVVFARTLATKVVEHAYIGNKSLADSICESAGRLLCWS